MKKKTLSLLVLLVFILASCATGSRPQRPKPLKSGHRHGGSVVMLEKAQQQTTQQTNNL
ncbi:MAG: hypothetical protein P4L28_02885 [Paludibacteraceae bacterium]|nr:hypothetical protein [Paludibacteraceae bacterium]